jgi:hypothetical protein
MGIGCGNWTVNDRLRKPQLKGYRTVVWANFGMRQVYRYLKDMNLRFKHSIAVMIFKEDKILATYRPEDDDELPDIWGLPAGTCRSTEGPEDVIRRIGRDKLGVLLQPVRLLASGDQDRSDYKLEMELWEASMVGEPTHPNWKWASLESLAPGASKGSLCCTLALKHKSRVSF